MKKCLSDEQKEPRDAAHYVDVSKNNGTPKIIHFNRAFHSKLSILGYPYFWKHPCSLSQLGRDEKKTKKKSLRPGDTLVLLFAWILHLHLAPYQTFGSEMFFQWLFLVPLIGGRWYIITQLAVYTTYIPFIYCLLGGLYATYHLLRGTRNNHCFFFRKKKSTSTLILEFGGSLVDGFTDCTMVNHKPNTILELFPSIQGIWSTTT